ncbi:MAG: glutathione peroxidase [Bacteroidota bacterium]
MQTSSSSRTLHHFQLSTINGEDLDLSRYQGKVVLAVNVASKCGLTPQYRDLQELHERYAAKGLVVLGLPANNFMGQEPGNEDEIARFCEINYGVSFPMTHKISVLGEDQHPLYRYFSETTGDKPKWNFHKYLINKEGEVVQSIAPTTKVDDPAVLTLIDALLAQP